MILRLISFVVFIVAVIFGLSYFLQPNDLAKCTELPDSSLGCQKVDAIIAISGGDTAARANEAIRMYLNGWADYIIFSGAAQDKTGPSNASVMKQLAIDAGVSESVIYIDEDAETTRQNAENVQQIINEKGFEKIILVTSGYHQRRASNEFKGHTTAKVLNHPVDSDKDWSSIWWISPRGWYLAVSELIKTAISSIADMNL